MINPKNHNKTLINLEFENFKYNILKILTVSKMAEINIAIKPG